jgi:1-deoxy-D-xylulose-5-phosphate synthase
VETELIDEVIDNLLDKIDSPSDLRKLEIEQLEVCCTQLREATIELVANTGGHLGAGLGVIELTIALHYVFDTPKDKVIWDVSHQCYPHKILTERKNQMTSLRQENGLSGFCKRSESIYDTFGAGHSSTSISAAIGFREAYNLKNQDNNVIAVIGDGAMSAGMAYEALNNAAHNNSKLIVILNDNKMSISPAVGSMNKYLSRLVSSKEYVNIRQMAKNALHILPSPVENTVRKAEQFAKNVLNNTSSNIFEDLGFYYIGPIDGHDIEQLVKILSNVKNNVINKPVLIHAITEKGKGFYSKTDCAEKYHAVGKFDIETGEQNKPKITNKTYSQIFGDYLSKMAEKDDKVVAITAAMESGTGLSKFANKYKNRFYDVGIAEQHAVTFAAGLACEGIKPYVAIYSTFMQRAYDQIIHDVAIQSLPVRFMMDRAGLVGNDGATHVGAFDIAFLSCLPNFVIMAPSDENEFIDMMETSLAINDRPCSIRYPRGEVTGLELKENGQILEIGKGRIIKYPQNNGLIKAVIISLGTRLTDCIEAANKISDEMDVTIFDARFIKPMDDDAIYKLALSNDIMITIEEGSVGGFGSYVGNFLLNKQIFSLHNLKFKTLCLPDYFIDHKSQKSQLDEAGLNVTNIIKIILSLK